MEEEKEVGKRKKGALKSNGIRVNKRGPQFKHTIHIKCLLVFILLIIRIVIEYKKKTKKKKDYH